MSPRGIVEEKKFPPPLSSFSPRGRCIPPKKYPLPGGKSETITAIKPPERARSRKSAIGVLHVCPTAPRVAVRAHLLPQQLGMICVSDAVLVSFSRQAPTLTRTDELSPPDDLDISGKTCMICMG